MVNMNNIFKLTEEYLDNYCQGKKYTIKKETKDNYKRIEVSNVLETIPLTLYETGKLVVGGSPKGKLRPEFEGIKQKLTDQPEILGGVEIQKIKSCSTKYSILLPATRESIKNGLGTIDGAVHYYDNPTPSEEYRAKLTTGSNSVSVTQYKNGTLFLQGKEDDLFSNVCDLIEKIATPSEVEIISRFFANDEESLKAFTASYSPALLEVAEKQIRDAIGTDTFDFLESHDQKWFIAAECLRIANIPLPEYSPIVMPASKAFEGYIKKLLIKVGFYAANHFATKGAKFDFINDPKSPIRIAFVAKEKYADTFLKEINLALDTHRNFMMHSDDSTVTKLDTFEKAIEKLDDIYRDIVKIHSYFKSNPVFGL